MNQARLALLPRVTKALFTLLLLSGLTASQTLVREISVPNLWVVDAAGSGDFSDLPAAVATARSGDTLLVRPGNYSGFTLSRKGLTIVGVDGLPRVLGPTTVANLPGRAACVLRSLDFAPGSGVSDVVTLAVSDNAGAVWLEDCQVRDTSWANPAGPSTGALLEIRNSESVSVTRCFVGYTIPGAFSFNVASVAALSATDSTVWAFDSTFVGGGVRRFGSLSRPGGNGATLGNTTFYASGSSFEGGQGSPALDNTFVGGCTPAGDGGVGLEASGAGTAPILIACTQTGGLRGLPDGGCRGGADGAASTGSLQVEPLPYRGLTLSAPSLEARGTDRVLTATGAPNELVWSVSSSGTDGAYVPLYFGPRLTGAQPLLVFEGTTDATGALTTTESLPPLATLAFQRRYVQGLFFDGLGNAYLGSPTLQLVIP